MHICQSASGPVGRGSWEVDGTSSTGIFEDARGSGEITIAIGKGAAGLSGKLKLAGSAED